VRAFFQIILFPLLQRFDLLNPQADFAAISPAVVAHVLNSALSIGSPLSASTSS
jgi:hypothetical protein